MRRHALTVLVLTIVCSVAAADTLYLKNGGKLEGKLVKKTATDYVFNVQGVGVQRIPVEAVLRVKKGKSAVDEYKRRASALKPKDATGHYRLGIWCEQHDLYREWQLLFDQAFELDPDLVVKHGFVRYDRRWMKAEAAEKLRADRYAGKAMGVDEFFHSYEMEKSRRLPGADVWYWPPHSWKTERFRHRPKVVLWGPVVSGVAYRIGLEVVDTTVPKLRKETEASLVVGRGYRVDDKADIQRIGPSGALMIAYRGGPKEHPVLRYHALIRHGSRTLHVWVVGPSEGGDPVFMRMILSDVLSTIRFERPPDLGEKSYGFHMPPGWAEADEVLKDWHRQERSASGDLKKKLNFRIIALLLTRAQCPGSEDRVICCRDRLTTVSVMLSRRLGMSTLPLEQWMKHIRQGDDAKEKGEVTTRRVAGRKALLVEKLDCRYCYCVFSNGDKLYELVAGTLGKDGRSRQALKAGLNEVLDTFRLP